MDKNLTFEQLPKAVTMLIQQVSEIKNLIVENSDNSTQESPEQLFNVQQAAQFLKLTVPTIYSKVSNGELPVMKRGKRLYFSSIELLDYLKEGRKLSNKEIEQRAEAYLSNNKKP